MRHILIVEDEPAIADTLVYALEADGFAVTWHSRGADCLAALAARPVDLVILDVGLPDSSGFEVCRQLRKTSEVPVMFLTARGDEIDRVVGLEIGADDYVVKPFSPREVVARVRAILKRSQAVAPAAQSEPPAATLFSVDEPRLRIHYRGQPLGLTPHEFRLLAHLLRQPGRVFSREQLLQAIGVAEDAGYDRVIDGHIKALRAKLRAIDGDSGSDQSPIHTHRGFGYSVEQR